MLPLLFVAVLLSFSDPLGDAYGDGNLGYPSAEVFRTPGIFDARELQVLDTASFNFTLALAQVTNPWHAPYGFSLPIVEIYLDTRQPGHIDLLPGSGMQLPQGASWNYAFRLTGWGIEAYGVDADTLEVIDVSEAIDARLELQGATLVVTTTLPRPRRFSLYGAVGSYDPFDATGWRRVEAEPSPWAFSSETQRVRAVDVLAESDSLQVAAIQSGVLPEIRAPSRQGPWIALLVAGVILSLVGLLGRVFVTKPKVPHAVPSVSPREVFFIPPYPALPPGRPESDLAEWDLEDWRDLLEDEAPHPQRKQR